MGTCFKAYQSVPIKLVGDCCWQGQFGSFLTWRSRNGSIWTKKPNVTQWKQYCDFPFMLCSWTYSILGQVARLPGNSHPHPGETTLPVASFWVVNTHGCQNVCSRCFIELEKRDRTYVNHRKKESGLSSNVSLTKFNCWNSLKDGNFYLWGLRTLKASWWVWHCWSWWSWKAVVLILLATGGNYCLYTVLCIVLLAAWIASSAKDQWSEETSG